MPIEVNDSPPRCLIHDYALSYNDEYILYMTSKAKQVFCALLAKCLRVGDINQGQVIVDKSKLNILMFLMCFFVHVVFNLSS